MIREEWAERLPLIHAFVEGKTIECRYKDDDNDPWNVVDNPRFELGVYDYRIKPEPSTIWLAEDGSIFNEEKHAQDYQEHYKIKCKKYVEVVE